ncbi:hypothetical protein [Stenotrophomonas sp. PS02300]|uniref:hypothetical protein n=1 Tax=Stenotrophomonas sp. PS02300 TaxID=2991426 RepID=UPI00249A2F77|nr:hypothetical protein [Stenotrophomonas sp. PS02300]
MPTTAADHRHAAGRFHARAPFSAPVPRPLDATTIRRVETPMQALAALLSVTNAASVPITTVRPQAIHAVASTPVGCNPVPVSPGLAGMMRDVAGLLRSPMTELVTDARVVWERHEGVHCAPPLSAGMRALLQVGDALVSIAEAAVLGGRSVLGMQEAAVVLDAGADVLEHRPPGRTELTNAVMALGGMHGLEPGAPAGPEVDEALPAIAASRGSGESDTLPALPRRPGMTIRQTTAELHHGRIQVRFEGAERDLTISEGRLQVLTDRGSVDVVFDTGDWQWKRAPATRPETSGASRPDSSIAMFDHVAEQVHQQAPMEHARLRLDLLGPDGILYYNDPAAALAGNAVCVDGRYYAATLTEGLGLRIGAVELVKRDGVYQLREQAPRPVRTLRCRRAPGEACSALPPEFSRELSRQLEAHHGQALGEHQARRRGIAPDVSRPGWYMSRQGNRLRHYLRFNDRYFRVRLRKVDEHTQRISVYLPRGAGAGRLHHRNQPAHRIADIRQAIPAQEHRFMTQAEFNVEYRGMPSLEAAQVYESAVAQNARLRLSQLQRAALRSYLTWRRRSMDDFLQYGSLQPVFRDSEQAVARINRALARIPPHAGRVYTALALDAAQFAGLQEGQTLYSRTFLVASGDRGRAVHAAAAASSNSVQGATTLVTLAMRQHAHPTGLLSLQDEAQVMIGNNVLFKVVGKTPGELHLEELGAARQAMGTLGAQTLLAIPLRD